MKSPGVLTIFMGKPKKFWLENQVVRAIPLGKLWKIWALIQGDAIFLLFLICSADWIYLAAGHCPTTSSIIKFYVYMHNISVVVQFYPWFKFYFPMFCGMVNYV